MKNKRIDKKTFYIVSSLSRDRSWEQLSFRKMYESEKEATEMAESLVLSRQEKGFAPLSFFILKAVARVGYATPPIQTDRLK